MYKDNDDFIHELSAPCQAIHYTSKNIKYETTNEADNDYDSREIFNTSLIYSPMVTLKDTDYIGIKDKLVQNNSVDEQMGNANMSEAALSLANRVRNMDMNSNEGESSNAFQNYFHLPDLGINQKFLLDTDMEKEALPALIHHNSQMIENIVYVFGGLRTVGPTKEHLPAEYIEWKLPHELDISDFIIHFPYELPKPISETLIVNPLLTPSNEVILYNNITSSVTYAAQIGGCPIPPLLMTTSVVVSHRHIFYYGGFQLVTDNVIHDEQRGKWIIYKKIVMNNDGYILDTASLNFTKINLRSKTGNDIISGRIGNAIVGNTYDSEKEPPPLKKRPSFNNGFKSSQFREFNNDTDSDDTNRSTRNDFLSPTSTGNSHNSSPHSPRHSPHHNSPHTAQGKTQMLSHVFHSLKKKARHTVTPSNDSKVHVSEQYDNVQSPKSDSSLRLYSSMDSSGSSLHARNNGEKINPKSSHFNSFNSGNSPSSLSRSTPIGHIYLQSPATVQSEALTEEALGLDGSNENIKNAVESQTIANVIIYVFGGFVLNDNKKGGYKIENSNELLRIELIVNYRGSEKTSKKSSFFSFNKEALVTSFNEKENKQEQESNDYSWPPARGFFGFIVRDGSILGMNKSGKSFEKSGASNRFFSTHKYYKGLGEGALEYYKDKIMIIHGGINSRNEVLSDLYIFHFDSGKWYTLDQYTHRVDLGIQSPDNYLQLAKLSLCFHQIFSIDDYLFFLGGLNEWDMETINDPTKRKFKMLTSKKVTIEPGKPFDVSYFYKDCIFRFDEVGEVKNYQENRNIYLNLSTQIYCFAKYRHKMKNYLSSSVPQDPDLYADLLNAKFAIVGGSNICTDQKVVIIGGQIILHKFESLLPPDQRKRVEEMDGMGYFRDKDLLIGGILNYDSPLGSLR